MKTGRSITELAAEIQRQQTAKRDLVALTTDVAMLADGSTNALELSVGDDAFSINEIAHDQIGTFTGIPSKYYDRMRMAASRVTGCSTRSPAPLKTSLDTIEQASSSVWAGRSSIFRRASGR